MASQWDRCWVSGTDAVHMGYNITVRQMTETGWYRHGTQHRGRAGVGLSGTDIYIMGYNITVRQRSGTEWYRHVGHSITVRQMSDTESYRQRDTISQ